MGVRIVKNNMGNVPERQVNAQHARTPHTSMPVTLLSSNAVASRPPLK